MGAASEEDVFAAGFQDLLTEQGLQALSIMAHEVRDPLAAICASTELLVDDLDHLEKEQVRKLLGGIRVRVLWLQGLVRNLLASTAIRRGIFHVQPQEVSLTHVLEEVQVVLQPLLEQRQQVFRFPTGALSPLPRVQADAQQLSQVLVNLTLNASRFAPRGSTIDVFVRRQLAARRRVVRVTVADPGPGLPPGDPARLFTPFYRAPSTGAQPGAGLGLAIVKSIVEAHGGRLGAYNRSGGGACFWFEIPLAGPEPSGNPPAVDRLPRGAVATRTNHRSHRKATHHTAPTPDGAVLS